MNLRLVSLLAIVLGALLALQLSITLLSDDVAPPRTTTMVASLDLPDSKQLAQHVGALTTLAENNEADRLIVVVDQCTLGFSRQPCKQAAPAPKASTGNKGAPPTKSAPATTSQRVQLVIDSGGPAVFADIVASQPSDTRVLDAEGRTVRSGLVEKEGPGALLFVLAAGFVGVLGLSGGWTLAGVTRNRPTRVAGPVGPPDGRTQILPPGPADRDKTTITDEPETAELVDIFLRCVPRERPQARAPQCPRCGSFDAQPVKPTSKQAGTGYRCAYCSYDWTTANGAAWPTVVVNPRARR